MEREILLQNLEAARKTSEDAFVLIDQLRRLSEELELAKGDSRSLKIKMNRTAIEFGLPPIPFKPTSSK